MKNFFVFILITAFSLFAISQPNQKNDTYTIEPFIDGVINSKLNSENIAGATLSIVKDGEVIVNKGYGFSNHAKRIPVDPDETLFRIGSISKLFVWLAVMQQVERGNLDLNRDINEYLVDFKIPDTFDDPITMTHLMSHTAGFEDIVLKLFTLDTDELKPLSDILEHQIPKRVRPAGVHASYSNHGTAIAAHIIEIISGMLWDDYVEQNIFLPMGMKSTTFRQPLPDSLAPRMSNGYKYLEGQMIEKPFELIPLAPAGSVSTTASDMASFMLMLLDKGQWNDTTIIDTSTYHFMMQPVMYHAELVNPCRYGFMDISHKGIDIIGHGGDTFWFHSLMALLPEQNMGIFLSFNSEGGGGTYNKVLDEFVDYFIDSEFQHSPTIELGSNLLEEFAGEYMTNRYPNSDYLKPISLMNRMMVTADEGKLKVEKNGKVSYWNPIGNLAFQKENEADIMVFERNYKGDIAHAFDGRLAIFVYDKVSFWQQMNLHKNIFFGAIILSIFTLIYWPMVYVIRRRYQPMSIARRTIPIGAKVIAWIAALLLLAFYAGIALSLSDIEASVYSIPIGLKFLLIIPFILIVLTLLMLYHSYTLWAFGGTSIRSRFFYTLLFFINSLALWQIYYWNFLGWNY